MSCNCRTSPHWRSPAPTQNEYIGFTYEECRAYHLVFVVHDGALHQLDGIHVDGEYNRLVLLHHEVVVVQLRIENKFIEVALAAL
jgi:hypothetical protein